ncbi:MAG: hypothetical protein WA138_15780 [Parvibaculum sp.]
MVGKFFKGIGVLVLLAHVRDQVTPQAAPAPVAEETLSPAVEGVENLPGNPE